MEQTISKTKEKVYNPERIFKKKSLLFSSDNPERLAEESSKARLIRDLIIPDGLVDKGYEEYLSKFPNLAPPYAPTCETHEQRNQFVTTYPSRVGLRWNPCVDVSSGEETPVAWRPSRKKSTCNCGNCTSKYCPSRKSSGTLRPVFKDNIMTFSDKSTMTVKLLHASCNAKTPIVSPNVSNASLSSSRSQPKSHSAYCPQYSNSSYRPRSPRSDSYERQQYYDQAVKDTDLREECSVLRNAYTRHCRTHNSGTQYGPHPAGKFNLYNEGISDKIADRYPLSTVHCPHKVQYGGRTFCMNKCPNCRCRGPSGYGLMGKDSKYHQRCKVEYKGPVYYDNSNENIRRVVAVPSFYPERYPAPIGRVSKSPSIILPKKVLTSERDIEGFIDEHQCKYERRTRRKTSK